MSHDLVQKRFKVSETILENLTTNRNEGPIDFTATAADIKFAMVATAPIDVYRFGVIAKTLIDVGAGMILTLGKSAVLTDLSSPTNYATLSTSTTDIAANTGLYRDVDTAVAQATGVDNSLVNVGPNGPMPVSPGEAVIITLTDVADTAGTGWVFIEYAEKAFAGSRISNMTKKTS